MTKEVPAVRREQTAVPVHAMQAEATAAILDHRGHVRIRERVLIMAFD
jgi:hypothetical protein